jgi:hypothetical protein
LIEKDGDSEIWFDEEFPRDGSSIKYIEFGGKYVIASG